MKGTNNKFDSEIRDKLNSLDHSSADPNWGLMLGKLMDEGLADLESTDEELVNALQNNALSVGATTMDWNDFEKKLSASEASEDSSFDNFMKSSLESVKPPLSNNSWNDFYKIYQNYLYVRRNVFASRILELSYIVLVFLFLGSFDFTSLWEAEGQTQNIVQTIASDNTSGLDDIDSQSYKNTQELSISGSGISKQIRDDSDQESGTLIPPALNQINVLLKEEKNQRTSDVVNQLVVGAKQLEVPKNELNQVLNEDMVLAMELEVPGTKAKKIFLASAYYGHSGVFKRNLLSAIPNNIGDGQFWSTNFAGLDMSLQLGGFELSTGINFKRNASMQQLIRDEIRQAEEISLLELPVNLKFFMVPSSRLTKPYVKFGSTGTLVTHTNREDLELVEYPEDKYSHSIARNTIEDKPDLSDFKQLYLSFDLGIGVERQLNSGTILFIDADYKHYMNNYRTEFMNPSYYMLDNISARVGGRWFIGQKN